MRRGCFCSRGGRRKEGRKQVGVGRKRGGEGGGGGFFNFGMGTGETKKDYIRFISIARFVDLLPVAEYSVEDRRKGGGGKDGDGAYEDRVDRVMRSGRVNESSRLTILDKDVGSLHYDSDESYVYFGEFSTEMKAHVLYFFSLNSFDEENTALTYSKAVSASTNSIF